MLLRTLTHKQTTALFN